MRLAPREALHECFQTPIARNRVRYVGEPLALVVALDPYTAEDALELIEAEFDPLPIIADTAHGRQVHANPIHPSLGSNTAERVVMRFGNPEGVLATAPVRVRETYRIQRHTGTPIETRGLIASFDEGTETVTVWGAAKVPHFNRQILAGLLNRPENCVRLIESDVGGGFGPRGEFYPEDFLIPWAAIRLQRPVKWIEDRREHMVATNHSREQEHLIEIGADRNGAVLSMVVRGAVDMGAYIRTNGFVIPERAAGFIPGPYKILNYLAEIDCVFTNKTPMGSYRGPGRFEAAFVRERALDLVARELEMDPADVRRVNLVPPEAMPYNSRTKAFGHDVVFDSGDYPASFERALERVGYGKLRQQQKKARAEGRYLGIGLCPFVEKTGVGPWETARVRIDGTGYVEIHTGVASVGQGMETVLAQICAEQLRISPDQITVRHGDTAVIPQGSGAFGSRGTVTGGSAMWNAAGELKEKLLRLAAHRLEVDPDDLELEGGAVILPGTDLLVSFRELAQAAMPGKHLPRDMEAGLDISSTYVVGETAHPYGTHVAIVDVDPELGNVKLITHLIDFDIGLAVNPMLVEGQLVGGFVQGLGGALLEELAFSPDGQPLSVSFQDYLLPSATDIPEAIIINIMQNAPSPNNPLGLKGAGEGGTVGAGAAIANAVEDALAPIDVRVVGLPLSPNAVFGLIRAGQRKQNL